MGNIEMEIESKFWEENGKWCVQIRLPEFDGWFENVWDKDYNTAKALMIEKVKKHVKWVREFKRSAEKATEVLSY